MTLTISCASYPHDGADRDALLRAADHRLHTVKNARGPPAASLSPGAPALHLA